MPIKPEFVFSMKQLEAKPRSTLKRKITFDNSGLSFDKELSLSFVKYSSSVWVITA